jgi:hypothetical protein
MTMPELEKNNQTPAPQAELEAARKATAEAAARAAEIEAETARLQSEMDGFRSGEALKQCVVDAINAIGQKACSIDAIKKLLSLGHDGFSVTNSPDGPELSYNGKVLPWATGMQLFYKTHETFFEMDVEAFRNREQAKANEVKARSDFRSPQHVTNYIAKHGLAAYEQLPLTRDTLLLDRNPHRLTAEQYARLSVAEKMKVLNAVGEDGVARIVSRKG